ncbi:hypothetical protein J437_LFUL000579 [Ladona fulva]|uniref:Groucho/TLE N-terminal Q-rich domain-containing protein n=1 Tax=Ladona fulva TaxID=123851 RepID=A0A8K0JUZ7_LADFU|nr:hypothetical protein J437_LFUL000579 [Ladona fulva]
MRGRGRFPAATPANTAPCAADGPPPPQPGQLKFTVSETCDRIKEEFNFLQAQYHSLDFDVELLNYDIFPVFDIIDGPPPPQPGQLKFTVSETCDRIKEEFNFLQAQYHSLDFDVELLNYDIFPVFDIIDFYTSVKVAPTSNLSKRPIGDSQMGDSVFGEKELKE